MKTKTLLGILTALSLLAGNAWAQITVTSIATANMAEPTGVTSDPLTGNLYIADSANNRIAVKVGTNAVVTYAGDGTAGTTDGPYYAAQFRNPQAVLYATVSGNNGLIIADTDNHSLRFINLADGSVSTLAGTSGTPGSTNGYQGYRTNALFRYPGGMSLDSGNHLYVADSGNSVIRVLNLNDADGSNCVSTLTVANTTFNKPEAVAVGSPGELWVADTLRHLVKRITLSNPSYPTNGSMTALIGTNYTSGNTFGDDVQGIKARFNFPRGLLWRTNSTQVKQLIISDTGNNRLRVATNYTVVNPTNYAVSTYAGTGDPAILDGDALAAKFYAPYGLAQDPETSVRFFIADRGNTGINGIRRIQDGTNVPPAQPTDPLFNTPVGVALNSGGNLLYIADSATNVIFQLNLSDNSTTEFVRTNLNHPVADVVDPANNLYVLNRGNGANGWISKYDEWGNCWDTLTPYLAIRNATNLVNATSIALDVATNLYVTVSNNTVMRFTPAGSNDFVATISDVGTDLRGLVVLDTGVLAASDAGNHGIWLIDPFDGTSTKFTGFKGAGSANGSTNFAQFNQPHHLTKAEGGLLIVADYANNLVRVVDSLGTVTNLPSTSSSIWFGRSGEPLGPSDAKFVAMRQPSGIALRANGDVFTGEVTNHCVRSISPTALRPSAPNNAVASLFKTPVGIALSTNTTPAFVYIADITTNAIARLYLGDNSMTPGFITTNLNQPRAVAVDGEDNLYVLSWGYGTNGWVSKYNHFGNPLGFVPNATNLLNATSIGLDIFTNLYVTVSNNAVIRIEPNGAVTNWGTITNVGAQLQGIAWLESGQVAVSDAANHAVFLIAPFQTHQQSLLTGLNGPGTTVGISSFAQLNQPQHLARAGGGLLLVADSGSDRVVVVDGFGTVTNLPSTNSVVWFGRADDPVSSGTRYVRMRQPFGVAIGANGDVFAGEVTNHCVRRITLTGLVGPGAANPGTPEPVPAPDFTPRTGYFPMGQIIHVTSSVLDVFYTTDGTDPTTNSTRVSTSDSGFFIRWNDPLKDLTSLRVRAFRGVDSSAVVSGNQASTNNVGIPYGLVTNNLLAGVGSTIILPVVANLKSNAQVQSFQFRVEVSPDVGAPPAIGSGFNARNYTTNEFVSVITSDKSGGTSFYSVIPYAVGVTNGLVYSALGTDANVSFKNFAVIASLEVPIPTTAVPGQKYKIQIVDASATSDAGQTPVAFSPIPATIILVTNVAYVVGDCVPGGWYNAGDFGDGDLQNNDVNTILYASLGLRLPPAFTDVFDSMDVYPEDAAGFVGGDGQIRYLDWALTFDRSTRINTTNWSRAWASGGLRTNNSALLVVPPLPPPLLVAPGLVWYRQAAIVAGSIGGVVKNAGDVVDVPVYVKVVNGANLAGLQFRAIVTPDAGAPALTQGVQFVSVSGAPAPMTQQFNPSEIGCGWKLGDVNCPALSSTYVGTVHFTIPANAQTGQNYTVHFANADGAPDLHTQYDFETSQVVVRVGALSPVPDGISDDWKIQFFGSTTNPLAAASADPDGDGSTNGEEFLNGTHPLSAASKLELKAGSLVVNGGQKQLPLRWLSGPGKVYAVESSANLAAPNWNTVSTVAGDGYEKQVVETDFTGNTRFYRVRTIAAP